MHDPRSTTDHYDVIIAGGGPVGLFLATELRLARASVLVLERETDPHTPLKGLPFGLRGLSSPTIEALYRRGLLDDLTALRQANERSAGGQVRKAAHWMDQQRKPGGHFAGIQFFLDNVNASKWTYRLPGPGGGNMATTMDEIETVLAARAEALGVDIERGRRVDGFEQSNEGVVVHAGDRTFHGQWLVGCDGGRSLVRKAAGFEFVGTDPEFTGYSVRVDLADEDMLKPGRQYTPTGMYTFQKPGTIAMVDFDGGAFHRGAPVTREHVEAVLRRLTGTDVTVTALHHATTWTDRAQQATAYRSGRVLLAGDAAHIHSPLGGQGLNLGLGDAMNLGWKLGAVVRGDAPEALLDTYFAERHPVGAAVLDWSRAQVVLMRPSRSSRALEAIIRDLIDTRDGATYFAERMWGVALRYDLGGGHPLVGLSVPDFEFENDMRLGDMLRSGRGILLDFDGHADLPSLGSRFGTAVEYVTGQVKNRLGLTAALVRPDGVVAWACDGEPDIAEAARAMSQWFSPDAAT